MKQILPIITALILLATSLAGCKSSRQAATEPQLTETDAPWQSVSMPVKVRILRPTKMTLSGTATMVRGKYALVNLRFMGFEVGQLCLTPENVDVVLRQPSRLWLHESMSERFKRHKLDFTTLQETLLGNRQLPGRIPPGVDITIGGSETAPEVTAKATVGGVPAEVCIYWDLDRAKWNEPSPRTFAEPGNDYRQTTFSQLIHMLPKGSF